MKDFELYRAMYCGVCKGIGQSCGQISRFGLSYDVTFLSVIFHNIKNCDVKLEKSSCITKCGVVRSKMAVPDDLTRALGALNTVLLYYKLIDDIADEKKGAVKRLVFARGFAKAKKKYPQVCQIVDRNMRLQDEREKGKCSSIDMAADATATMLAEISDQLLEEYATEYTHRLFYDLGKWIYVIDGLDDYEKDIQKNNYNPFYECYHSKDKQCLLTENNKDFEFLFNSLFYDMRECLNNIKFHFNRDLIDNILLRGLPHTTKRILNGCGKKDEKKETLTNE